MVQKQSFKDNAIKTGVKYEKCLISPSFAQELLQGNYCNRAFSQKLSDKYKRDMLAGKWVSDSAQPIRISTNMRVLDGQHRLHAIVSSGISVEMEVAYDVPETAMNVIDQGAKRSTANVFEINGIQNANTVSAIIKKYLAYKIRKNQQDPLRNGALPNDMVLDEYNQDPEMWQEVASQVMKYHKKFKNIEPSMMGAWYCLVKDIDELQAKDFFEVLSTGLGYVGGEKDSRYLLREYFMSPKAKIDTQVQRFAMFAKAWNFYRKRQLISLLRYTQNEEYPKLK